MFCTILWLLMDYKLQFLLCFFIPNQGRYSPVRRASEGSKAQFQGPLQECQYLQKGIAQRNFLVAPSPPLLENSISLPGKQHIIFCFSLKQNQPCMPFPLKISDNMFEFHYFLFEKSDFRLESDPYIIIENCSYCV